MRMNRILISAALAATVGLTLTGCIGHTGTLRADGTQDVPVDTNVTLFATPQLTAVPTWTLTKDVLPKGWAQDFTLDTAGLTQKEIAAAKLQMEMNPPPVYNADKTCYAQASTIFQPSFQTGRGDLYLTKQALYSSADSTFSPVTDEATYKLPQGNGKTIEAYSGYINAPGALFGQAQATTDTAPASTVTGKTFVASRAIDQLMADPLRNADAQTPHLSPEQIAAGMSIVTQPDYDMSKGLPTALINVSCTTDTALKNLDKQALLNAFTWNLK